MSHANVPLVVGVVFDDGSFLLDWLHGFLLYCTCTIRVYMHHRGAVHGTLLESRFFLCVRKHTEKCEYRQKNIF